MEDLVRSLCGAQDVQVDPPTRHRPQDEVAERAVGPAEPGDQQAAPGGREASADTREQLRSALPRGEADRDVVAFGLRLVERFLQLVDRAPTDGVVPAVAPAQLVEDACAVGRVVVGDHEQRLSGRGGHGAPAPILRRQER